MSPERPKPSSGEVPGRGLISTSGMMNEPLYWLVQPRAMGVGGGSQNIDDSPPEPEAAPAKDMPWATALCSRMPKAPALAPVVAAASAPSDTAASTSERSRILIRVVRPWNQRLLFASPRRRSSAGILPPTAFCRNLAAGAPGTSNSVGAAPGVEAFDRV